MKRFMKRPAEFSSAREDMISQLPDDLISQILLYLPTKEAVRTSVLSNRWKSVWLLIPELDLDFNAFPSENSFVGFIDKFLDFCSKGENSCFHKLKLSILRDENENGNKSCVTRLIDFVATTKLKHLDVECFLLKREFLEVMPISLYSSQTLLYLRLHQVSLGSFESVSLPCLKTMHLEQNVYDNETCLESLISSCPVLEDLSIVRMIDDNAEVLRVVSQSLIRLSVAFDFCENDSYFCYFLRSISGVSIDAPRLKYLKFLDEISRDKTVSNLNSLAKVEIVGDFTIAGLSAHQMACNFNTGISRVRHIIIDDIAMRDICRYLNVSIQFCNLSCLEAQFSCSNINVMSTFLESCPNLKSIILKFIHPDSMISPIICFSSVPGCLLSSLEFVKMICRYNGGPVEIEVAKYFVENSVVLKKLVVHMSDSMQRESLVDLRNLLTLTRRSSECQIEYVIDC